MTARQHEVLTTAEPHEALELDPEAYDDPDRETDEVTPVTGTYQEVDRQDEVAS